MLFSLEACMPPGKINESAFYKKIFLEIQEASKQLHVDTF